MGPSKQRLPRDAQTEIRLNQIARPKTPTDWKEEEGFEKKGRPSWNSFLTLPPLIQNCCVHKVKETYE